jgi:hypothetical protein
MTDQNPTPAGKDQYPHTDVANNEEGGTPEQFERGRANDPRSGRDRERDEPSGDERPE